MFWKYAVNLQENTHAEVGLMPKCNNEVGKQLKKLLCNFIKSDFGMGVSCIFAAFFQNTFSHSNIYKFKRKKFTITR